MELCGYAGRILRADLTSGSTQTEALDIEMAKQYLGGHGLNSKLAYDAIKPGIDPLGPENVILLGAGPLCGTPIPGATKVIATTKSPLNGAIATAASCGRFGPMLKWAGYDNIVITGASAKPVYLLILDDDVQVCDASDIWGKDIYEASDALRDKHGDDVSMICIGQAGENLVRISLALVDKVPHLGRGGFAAVMGSKKLKAIVVRGTRGIRIANPDVFQKMYDFVVGRALTDRSRPQWIKYGLQGIAETWFDVGIMLTDNRREVPDAEKMKAQFGMNAFNRVVEAHPWAGASCITCDKSVMRVKCDEFEGLQTTASVPSSPTISFGIAFDMNINKSMKCHDIFQRYGIDELDGAYLIGLVIELYEKGLISKEELGLEPKPDYATVSEAAEKMVKREGFWSTVADGIPAVLEKVPEAAKYVIHNKGMNPAFDGRVCLGVEAFGDAMMNPRGGQSFSLVRSPSTAITGIPKMGIEGVIAASYQVPKSARARIFPKEQEEAWNVARLTPYVQDINTGYNCLGLCYRFFIGRLYNPVVAAGVYQAVTGIPLTAEQFITAGVRVFNLQKAANLREGFDRKDDKFPERWVTEPIKRGDQEIYLQDYAKTRRLSLDDTEVMLDDYYEEREWDKVKGAPGKEKLAKLGLGYVAEDLEKRSLI